tara:strand:+ start:577 stop:1023 length:447 start_codon:yes stop_codon:yes gene_type:complete
VDAQIRVLSAQGGIKANQTLDGTSSPFLLDKGYLLYEQLIDELGIDGPDSDASEEHANLNFSDDYTSAVWEGEAFTFNPTQALCIRILHEAFSTGVPWVSSTSISKTLSENGIIDTRISYIFRNHQAWKSLIISERRSSPVYKLNIPY